MRASEKKRKEDQISKKEPGGQVGRTFDRLRLLWKEVLLDIACLLVAQRLADVEEACRTPLTNHRPSPGGEQSLVRQTLEPQRNKEITEARPVRPGRPHVRDVCVADLAHAVFPFAREGTAVRPKTFPVVCCGESLHEVVVVGDVEQGSGAHAPVKVVVAQPLDDAVRGTCDPIAELRWGQEAARVQRERELRHGGEAAGYVKGLDSILDVYSDTALPAPPLPVVLKTLVMLGERQGRGRLEEVHNAVEGGEHGPVCGQRVRGTGDSSEPRERQAVFAAWGVFSEAVNTVCVTANSCTDIPLILPPLDLSVGMHEPLVSQ